MPKCRICDRRVPSEAELCPGCGAPLPASTTENSAESKSAIGRLLDEDRPVDAVSYYRDTTGVSLEEAKKAVETLEKGAALAADLDAGLHEELSGLVHNGQKLQAIKLYRERLGCSLTEAKNAVEALAPQHTGSSQGGGCATVLAILLVTGCGSSAFFVWRVAAHL